MSTTTRPALLTAEEARRLTARIRDALVTADALIVTMWRGRGWEALGYPAGAPGWRAYCAAELPELRTLSLRAPARDELARNLHREGASLGAIADALAIGKATAHAAVVTMPDRPATVTALDGRVRRAMGTDRKPPRPPAAPVQPYTAELLALLAAGPLTVAEVCARTGRHHGAASAALSRLAATGRATYTPGARRGLHGLYSTTEGTR